ncbi:MAG: iron-containing alcohol dehydrogenase [Solirubrobacterales bacterium]
MTTLDQLETAREDFVWKDGERLIAFGASALASLPGFLRAAQMEEYVLLTTERGLDQLDSVGGGDVRSGAVEIVTVGEGNVADLAAELLDAVGARPIVAVGGGRVIDVGKAVGGASDQRVAAIPSTLSGAPMTGVHRLPAGFAGQAKTVRPAIVIGIPDLMASQPPALRTGSAMNALSHAIESAFVTTSSPVPRLAAIRGIELIFRSLVSDEMDEVTRRVRMALGAIEAGYAVGASGYALHHVICQTIVRMAEVPHAPTYGVMLPYTLEFYKVRDALTWQLIADAMGTADPSVELAQVCASAGNPTSLTDLGVNPARIEAIIASASERRELALTPGGANADEIKRLVSAAN